jgi:hypothetical protein
MAGIERHLGKLCPYRLHDGQGRPVAGFGGNREMGPRPRGSLGLLGAISDLGREPVVPGQSLEAVLPQAIVAHARPVGLGTAARTSPHLQPVVVNNLSFTGQICRPFVHGHVTH